MATVYAPNRETNGIHAGVEFIDGVAETDSVAALAYFRRQGYRIEHGAGPEPEPDVDLERPARSAKVADWRAYAEALGVDSSGSKDEIIARFDEAAD